MVRSASYLFATADATGLDLERIAAFAAGYGTQVPLTQASSDDAAERAWWKRMTDLWILKFRYDPAGSSCAHLYATSCAVGSVDRKVFPALITPGLRAWRERCRDDRDTGRRDK